MVLNPYVVELDLTGNLLGDTCIELLVHCSHLHTMHLAGNRITDLNLSLLTSHAQLKFLDLSYNHITDTGIECFVANQTLSTLLLNGNKIHVADKLAANIHLSTLSLKSNEITSTGIHNFIHNTTLKNLYLDDNLLEDENVIELAQNNTLEEISLNFNQLTDKSAIAFAESSNSNLNALSLAYNDIGDYGAAAFEHVTQIRKLNLAGNHINNAGIASLAQNSSIEWLDLSYNHVDDTALSAFAFNKALKYLNVAYNQISAKGIPFLLQIVQLTSLLLNYNSIGDEGAILLANSQLTYLDLTGNGIGFEGAGALAENTSVQTLILTANDLGDAGAMLLAHNKHVSILRLCYNRISNAGALTLSKNTTLKVLDLNYNQIEHKGRAALEANPHITCLGLVQEQSPDYNTVDKIQLIFSFSQSLLCILDKEGRIQFCNPAFVRLFGYQDNELLHESLFTLLHPEDRPDNHPLAKLSPTFPTANIDNRFLCKDGSYRIIRWNAQLKGSSIYSAGTDITEQKKSEREYYRLQQQKELNHIRREEAENYSRQQTEFIAHLSHEIRNPLSGAYSITELMEDQLHAIRTSHPQELEKIGTALNTLAAYVTDLQKCIKYPEDILNDNLDVAKISEKKLVLKEEVININHIMVDAIKILQAKAKQKGLQLGSQLPGQHVWVKGDASRIKQIIINLLSNAIKFTNTGEIKLILNILENSENTYCFEIRVTDTGIGMTNEEIGQLFRRFSQANITIGEQYGGTGLGLYITKKLSRLMGGDITVESKMGQGTTFICRLLCKKLSVEETQAKAEEEATRLTPMFTTSIGFWQQRKPTVLVVEDNEINRRILCSLLQKNNEFICIEAENGQQAIQQFEQQPIDIILMDMIMPLMNGIDATLAIRAKERAQHRARVPIIAVTGNALERDEKKALEAGIDAYLTKPYSKEQLVKTIFLFLNQPNAAKRQKRDVPLENVDSLTLQPKAKV